MPSKEGKLWRGVVWVDGKRISQKRGFTRKGDAIDWERKEKKRQIEISERRQRGMDLITFCTDYADYSEERFTKKVYKEKRAVSKRILKAWKPNTLVADITPKMAEKYLLTQKKKRSANAANKDLKNLKSMWNKGIKTYGVEANPFNDIQKFPHDRSPQYTPPPEDILRVLMVATREERIFLEAYLQTGARRSEIFRWTWVEDINFDARQVRLGTRKTRDGSMEYEWIPMSSELYDQLMWLWENRNFKRSPYVFVDGHPGAHYGKPFTTRRRFMPGLCKRADVKAFGFHALRRYVASLLIDKKKSMKAVQRVLRHKNLATTERYTHLLNNDLKEVYEALSERNHPKAPPQEAKKATTDEP
jgi:integrase